MVSHRQGSDPFRAKFVIPFGRGDVGVPYFGTGAAAAGSRMKRSVFVGGLGKGLTNPELLTLFQNAGFSPVAAEGVHHHDQTTVAILMIITTMPSDHATNMFFCSHVEP